MHFKIAVLGATGYVASRYRRELREVGAGVSIVAVTGRRIELLERAAAEDGAVYAGSDLEQALDTPGVNLALVCTPDAFHFDAVQACCERGVHVFCEKPLGKDIRQAETMWQSVKSHSLAHFVPFWMRYVPLFQLAKQRVEGGDLGEVKSFVVRWYHPRPSTLPFTWRDDATVSTAGTIADIGSHAYDILRWLLGGSATRVLVHADTLSPPKPVVGDVNLGEAIEHSQRLAEDRQSNGGTIVDGDHSRAKRGSTKTEVASERRAPETFDYASMAIEFSSGPCGIFQVSQTPYLRRAVGPELELHGSRASLSLDRLSGNLILHRDGCAPDCLANLPDRGLGNRFEKFAFPAIRERCEGRGEEHPGFEDGLATQFFIEACLSSAERGEWSQLNARASSL